MKTYRVKNRHHLYAVAIFQLHENGTYRHMDNYLASLVCKYTLQKSVYLE